jgi:hypothetical protein
VHRHIRRRFRSSEGGIDLDAAVNADISVNVGRQEKEERMGEQEQTEYQKLSREELNKLAGEELPERAAMSLINANIAAPINAAVALNVASDNSVAYANAEQTGDINQSI